jgi:hypothetical protein
VLEQSIADDASPVEFIDKLYEKHCRNGANIYVRSDKPLNFEDKMSNLFSPQYERSIANLDHKNEAVFGESTLQQSLLYQTPKRLLLTVHPRILKFIFLAKRSSKWKDRSIGMQNGQRNRRSGLVHGTNSAV